MIKVLVREHQVYPKTDGYQWIWEILGIHFCLLTIYWNHFMSSNNSCYSVFLFLRLDQLTRFRLSWIHSFLFLIWMLFDSLWFVMLFITKSFSTFNAFKIVEELGTLQFVSKKVIISKMKVECRQWDWYCHVWTGYKSVNTRLLTQHFQTCTVRYSPFSR